MMQGKSIIERAEDANDKNHVLRRNIFNSKGAMMVFIIAMSVIVACAAAMATDK